MAKKKAVRGRGRKQCPKCKSFVGVRTITCDCGYEFPGRSKVGVNPRAAEQDRFRNSLIAEKNRLEEQLRNRELIEKRLKKIDELLQTFGE